LANITLSKQEASESGIECRRARIFARLSRESGENEIDMIKQALADSQFNQKKTAEKLSLTYHQLRGYLKKYNLLDSSAESVEA
jgi:transcriptional regulator with GAF, ATPase, and Fis domain